MKAEHITAILAELRLAGARDVTVLRCARHPRVQWTARNGEPRVYVLPGTPSDRRGPANARADVRRMLRDDGMLVELPRPVRAPTPMERLRRRVRELEAELRRRTVSE